MYSIFDYEIIKNKTMEYYGEFPENWETGIINSSEKPLVLFSYDVDSIKNYIFSSNEFKAIMGASYIVKEFDSFISKESKVKGYHVVNCIGGTGLFLISKNEVSQLKELIESSFKKIVIGGTLTTSWCDFWPFELINGLETKGNDSVVNELDKLFDFKFNDTGKNKYGFSSVFSKLASKMRDEKNSKLKEFKTVTSDLEICESCLTYPASEKVYLHDEKKYFCSYCKEKYDKGKEILKLGIKDEKNTEFSDDFMHITKKEIYDEENWMAVIYIDGNSLGKIYSNINTEKDYVEISKKIEEATVGSVAETVRKYELSRKFAALILGGDDILLFVPCDIAVNFFIDLSETLKNNYKEIGISFCGSLLFVKNSLPLKMIFEASEKLLKSAKKAYYNGKKNECYVASRVLYENTSEPVEKIKVGMFEEILGEGETLSDFIFFTDMISKISKEEKNLIRKYSAFTEEVYEIAELNFNYYYSKEKEKFINIDEKTLKNKILFKDHSSTNIYKFFDIYRFIREGENNENNN
ncbi:MAG TPA: hypothetical protein PLS66_01410 [Tepiditoga sp.]|nr:hypothetical protein [Tepiditoga sp.]